MQIEYKKISEIIPYPTNAKMHPSSQVKLIANSIKAFGFRQPLVLDAKGVIIIGHGRYEAAKMLGLEEVPCHIADLTEEQAKSYRLADNKLNESEWDMALVMQELRTLSAPMVDLSGFGALGINLDETKLSDQFQIGEGEKGAFQQMSFVLSDGQASYIKEALKFAREQDDYELYDHEGNENKNGSALAYIVKTWMEQKISP